MLATSPKAIEESCDQLLAGGDASPCELIPAGDVEDPAWRYYLLNPYGSPPSILMAAHGAPINERLPRLLINYSGSRIIAP
ncbi:MAG: hypothetical protein QM296_05540, partial [Bacillota bacterium]|nr:hypothetical protein [Bacillota bacterium]